MYMYMYMYMYVCMYIYIYIYINIHVYIYIYTIIYVYIYIYRERDVCVYIYIYIYIYVLADFFGVGEHFWLGCRSAPPIEPRQSIRNRVRSTGRRSELAKPLIGAPIFSCRRRAARSTTGECNLLWERLQHHI